MQFTSEQHLADGSTEREFTIADVPGILRTPASAVPGTPASRSSREKTQPDSSIVTWEASSPPAAGAEFDRVPGAHGLLLVVSQLVVEGVA